MKERVPACRNPERPLSTPGEHVTHNFGSWGSVRRCESRQTLPVSPLPSPPPPPLLCDDFSRQQI